MLAGDATALEAVPLAAGVRVPDFEPVPLELVDLYPVDFAAVDFEAADLPEVDLPEAADLLNAVDLLDAVPVAAAVPVLGPLIPLDFAEPAPETAGRVLFRTLTVVLAPVCLVVVCAAAKTATTPQPAAITAAGTEMARACKELSLAGA